MGSIDVADMGPNDEPDMGPNDEPDLDANAKPQLVAVDAPLRQPIGVADIGIGVAGIGPDVKPELELKPDMEPNV